jgi:hypothetical protein
MRRAYLFLASLALLALAAAVAAFDRSPASAGMDAWDLGPPNGAVSGTDFFAMLAQFGHGCG